jgi:hypothetical protein
LVGSSVAASSRCSDIRPDCAPERTVRGGTGGNMLEIATGGAVGFNSGLNNITV